MRTPHSSADEQPQQDDQQLQQPVKVEHMQPVAPEIVEQHYLDAKGRRRPIKVKILARSSSDAPSDKVVRAHREQRQRTPAN